MREKRHTKNKKKRTRLIYNVLLIAGTLLFLAIGTIAGYYGNVVKHFVDDVSVSEDVDPAELKNLDQRIKSGEPFSALILGIDVEDDGVSRSDTIIATTINPKKGSVKMVSIPRDTLVSLPGGQMEKINAAYAVGKIGLARQIISEYLDIPLDFYGILDFNGLIALVDAVGGITVDAPFDFDESDYREGHGKRIYIKKGKQRLNGDEALAYARMRYQDERGDFGRQDRQKEIIISLTKELASISSLTNIQKILKSIQPYLLTNLSSSNILAVANKYSAASNHIKTLHIEGPDGRPVYFPNYGQNLWAWGAWDESRLDIQNELRRHLELPEKESLELVGNYQYFDSPLYDPAIPIDTVTDFAGNY